MGIFRRDGAPVERPLLYALTKFLSFRGPDAQEVWSDGAVGFGHTMLRTTREAANERQPASLEGRFWITADVRLDCRSELIEALQQAGRRFDSAQITDPELILHAYAAWGEGCVDKLRGDFAFALWDARERRLFCARDHFGVKPFFYVAKENQFLFSNTLNCLRAHPDVSDGLNDEAIGDFLLFGLNCDVATTTFRDIQRLSPAHLLVVSAEGLRTQKYWAPPIDGRIRYKRDEEYVEHFLEIFKAAVADRLRTDSVGIFLSGGLDSGSIAAMARELSDTPAGAKELRAYTTVYKSLFRDEEGNYASETAERLKIPIQFLSGDDFRLFERWADPEVITPEPVENPFLLDVVGTFRAVASSGRVVFCGHGPDNLMDFQMWPYAKDLFRRREWRTLGKEITHFLWVRPFPWRGLMYRGKRVLGLDDSKPTFPKWIREDFAGRMNLRERWQGMRFRGDFTHPVAPRAHASLAMPLWADLLENADPGVTRSLVEVRYPFLDLRVVNYVLSIPPFPWFFQKALLRRSMESKLPGAVLERSKTPLAIHPVEKALGHPTSSWLNDVAFCDEISQYVIGSELLPLPRLRHSEEAYVIIRPLCLNFWLQSCEKFGYKLEVEVHNA